MKTLLANTTSSSQVALASTFAVVTVYVIKKLQSPSAALVSIVNPWLFKMFEKSPGVTCPFPTNDRYPKNSVLEVLALERDEFRAALEADPNLTEYLSQIDEAAESCYWKQVEAEGRRL